MDKLVDEKEFPFRFLTVSWIYGSYKDANEFLIKDRESFERQVKKIIGMI